MEEMAFEPPEQKKDVYWSRRDVVVVSMGESSRENKRRERISKSRRRGMLVARH